MNVKQNLNQEKFIRWLLIIPALLLLLLVFVYPITRAFSSSFYQQNLGTELIPVFTGLNNYTRLLGDGRFWQSLWNTSIFTGISLALELILGMVFALILNQSFRGRSLVRTTALIPWALPTAVMGLACSRWGVFSIVFFWQYHDTKPHYGWS